MGKKKDKKEKLKKKDRVTLLEIPKNCKSSCCKKYKKGENKRCSRCPMFDLLKKVA